MKKTKILTLAMMLFSIMLGTASCSEEDDTVEEFPDWQAKNNTFFNHLSDSVSSLLAADPARTDWKRIKSWSKPSDVAGVNADYIIVHVEEAAAPEVTGSPIYTDTVTVSYMGRLLPSVSYPSGFVFDRTFEGEYDKELSASVKFAIGDQNGTGLVDGFATALQNMRRGDRWTVYIPYQLGYKGTASGGIPAFSTLIFEIVLQDYWGAKEVS